MNADFILMNMYVCGGQLPTLQEANCVRRMKLAMPLEGWTINQSTSLMRMLYCKQKLINPCSDMEVP